MYSNSSISLILKLKLVATSAIAAALFAGSVTFLGNLHSISAEESVTTLRRDPNPYGLSLRTPTPTWFSGFVGWNIAHDYDILFEGRLKVSVRDIIGGGVAIDSYTKEIRYLKDDEREIKIQGRSEPIRWGMRGSHENIFNLKLRDGAYLVRVLGAIVRPNDRRNTALFVRVLDGRHRPDFIGKDGGLKFEMIRYFYVEDLLDAEVHPEFLNLY